MPRLPADVNSPLADGENHTPAIAIAALVAIIIFALILLLVLFYFILLSIRGKCPKCAGHEDQLSKWQHGELKPVTSAMVQERMTSSLFRERMRAWYLEKGGLDLQVKMYKDRMRSLACLEGQIVDEGQQVDEQMLDGRTFEGRADSVWSQDGTIDEKEEGFREYCQGDAGLEEPPAARLAVTAAQPSEDEEGTLVTGTAIVNDFAHPKSHSAYLGDIVAPREAEVKRLLREAEDQRLERLMNQVSNQNNRDSVQERAQIEIKEIFDEREKNEREGEKEHMLAPMHGRGTRFQEHFSWSMDNDQVVG
jgi:hypothetical protein